MSAEESQLNRTTSWVERTGYQGIILQPRELSITGSDDKSNWIWHWLMLESQDHLNIEVPQLVGDCVYVYGECNMSKLVTGLTYEIAVMVMLKDMPEEGEFMVTLELGLPDGASKSHQVDFNELPKNQWLVLVIGDFVATPTGVFTFSMTSKKAKKGLIVKGAVVHPVWFDNGEN